MNYLFDIKRQNEILLEISKVHGRSISGNKLIIYRSLGTTSIVLLVLSKILFNLNCLSP